MKKLLFILSLFISFVAAAQPGPVNKYQTRVRYWQVMADSLLGTPSDTFNLRTPRAISYGWNMFPWITRKDDITYGWSIARQRWEAQIGTNSNVSIINDSTIQVCNGQNVCDTFTVNINPSTIISVSIINDSSIVVCNLNSCDTLVIHPPNSPPITTTTILNDSTIVVCNVNSCDTFVIHTPVVPPITTTTIINDSTIEVCNINSCDTIIVNTNSPPITTTTILNDSTIIVCDASGCDTIVIHQPITTTTVINDSTVEICTNQSCDTIVIHSPLNTTTIINDSTILVCNTAGACDTVVFNSTITNITVISDTTIQVCGSDFLGTEEITNGNFTGDASGWQLGALWAYDNNDILHSFGSIQATAQAGALVEGGTYRVVAKIGGLTGSVDVKLDAGTVQTYSAGAGTVTFTGTWSNANNYKIVLLPTIDFDGTIDSVSVRRVLPNCDTVQIPPTFFLDTFHIFVESPLHARNDSTIYITRASKLDSGFLSDSDFTYFWHKVDSIYTAPSVQGVDSFFYDNGDSSRILWYLNDVQPNGIISGGQVSYSGTPFIYNVTPAVYRINGVRYTSPATQLTIDTFDLANPRTDVFYVDTSGNARYLAGIAATPNLKPSIDRSWQLELTSLDIPAGGLPALDTIIVYNENVSGEWIPVTNQGTTTNPDNPAPVFIGSKSVDVTNINTSDVINFDAPTPTDVSGFQSINGYVRLKAPMPNAATLRAEFMNSTTLVSTAVTIAIDKTNTTTFQPFVLPISAFSLTSNVVTRFRIRYTMNNTSNFAGLYLDYIYLQAGVNNTPQGGNALINVFRLPGKDSVMGTYEDGTISYQFKDSTGAVFTPYVGRNGITDSVDRYILGGTLYKNTTIAADANTMTWTFNNISTNDGFSVTSTSTSANSGTQKLLNVALSGANSNANQVTFAGYFSNTHSGTNAQNRAIYGETSTTSSITAYLVSTGGVALFAQSSGGTYGAEIQSTTGIGAYIHSDNGGVGMQAQSTGSVGATVASIMTSTNTVVPVFQVIRSTTGTAANGIGAGIEFLNEADNGSNLLSNQLISKWTTAANATRISQLSITGVNNAVTNTLVTVAGTGATTIATNASGVADVTALTATATGAGTGGNFTANSGVGVIATSTSNNGLESSTTSGTAVVGLSVSGKAASFTIIPSSTNSVAEIARFARSTTGTAANGIGGSIEMYTQTVTGGTSVSNQIISKWLDATLATRTSELSLTGINSGTSATMVKFGAQGYMLLTPITAAAASAITPAEGMIVFVSDTDATFLTVGFWGYQGGTWIKM